MHSAKIASTIEKLGRVESKPIIDRVISTCTKNDLQCCGRLAWATTYEVRRSVSYRKASFEVKNLRQGIGDCMFEGKTLEFAEKC